MPKRILLGMLLVALGVAVAGLGYRCGRYLAMIEGAGQAAPTPGSVNG